ncbi:MAG: rod shape-determining protein MreC [Vicinamibacterales bacterium]
MTMALLDIRQRTGYLFVAVTIGHIILISAQVNTQRGVPVLEAVTFGVFAEVQRGATAMIAGIHDTWVNYFALQQVRGENERLRDEVARLRIELQREQALASQSRTLQDLLELKGSSALSTTAAAVIAGSASPDFRTVTIDKGANEGLRPDLAVIAPAGVVGRVITPSALAAKVQLLIDRNAAVGALDERSRAQGVVVGTGETRLRMEYVPGTADVQVGDAIVTSGIDGIYPKGFVIGQIESIERGSGEFTAIVIRPAVDFSTLESVLVVLSPASTADEPPE